MSEERVAAEEAVLCSGLWETAVGNRAVLGHIDGAFNKPGSGVNPNSEIASRFLGCNSWHNVSLQAQICSEVSDWF